MRLTPEREKEIRYPLIDCNKDICFNKCKEKKELLAGIDALRGELCESVAKYHFMVDSAQQNAKERDQLKAENEQLKAELNPPITTMGAMGALVIEEIEKITQYWLSKLKELDQLKMDNQRLFAENEKMRLFLNPMTDESIKIEKENQNLRDRIAKLREPLKYYAQYSGNTHAIEALGQDNEMEN